jgi:hypothetical protein
LQLTTSARAKPSRPVTSRGPSDSIRERGTTTSKPTSGARAFPARSASAWNRKRANALKLAARAHRVDERDAVDRIAAYVDDEQFGALLACVPRVGPVGAHVDGVAGSLGCRHQLGGEFPFGDEGDDVWHRGRG